MLKDLCFEIIQTCPNKCKFCSSNSSQDRKTIITLENFKKTVNYFIEQGGIEELSISGGEPFLHPDLFEMVRFCKSNDIKTVIFTSGIKRASEISTEMEEYIQNKCKQDLQEIEEHEPWNERLKRNVKAYYTRWLEPKEFEGIAKQEFTQLKNLGLDKIVFDWQAFEETTDNELMGRKGLITCLFDSIIRARGTGLNVDVHFIPMKLNYKQLPDIMECLEMVGVKKISILNFVPQGRGKENKDILMLNEQELQEFSTILSRAKEKFTGNVRIGIPLNGKIAHLCTAGTEKLDIKYDGTILPCPAFKEISTEIMEKYGIKFHSIYEDLEKVIVPGGKRARPLCKEIYDFHGDLTGNDQTDR